MSTATELGYLSIEESGRRLESGELSPVELTRAYLDRIESIDATLHSYIEVIPDAALEAAGMAEQEIRAGNYRGPLHGIPIALKDLFDTASVATTYGSKVYRDRLPAEDATVTARLKQAGVRAPR